MTVAELIEILKTYDLNLNVLVQGYEGGLCDVTQENIETITYVENGYESISAHNSYYYYYYGPHEEIFEHEYTEKTRLKGLVLRR